MNSVICISPRGVGSCRSNDEEMRTTGAGVITATFLVSQPFVSVSHYIVSRKVIFVGCLASPIWKVSGGIFITKIVYSN